MKKYIKHIIPFICVLVILFSNVTMASASTRAVEPAPDGGGSSSNPTHENIIDPFTDILTSSTTDNVKIFYVEHPAKSIRISLREHSISGGYSSTILNESGKSFFTAQYGPRYIYKNGLELDGYKYDLSVDFYSNNYYINCLRLDSTANIEITYKLDLDYLDSSLGNFHYPKLKTAYIHYYNSNFVRIGSYSTDIISTVTSGYNGTYKAVFDIDKPDNARYCSFTFNLVDLEYLNPDFSSILAEGLFETKLNVIPDRPTPVSFFDVVDEQEYYDGNVLYVVHNDDEIGSVKFESKVPGYELFYGDNFNSISFPGVVGDSSVSDYTINWRMFQPLRYLKIDPITSGSYALVHFEFSVDTEYTFYWPNIQVAIYYYASDFTPLTNDVQRNYVGREYEKTDEDSATVASLFQLEIPDNAEYMAVSVIMQSFRLYGNTTEVPVTISVEDYDFAVEIENYSYYYGQFLIDSANRLGNMSGQLGVNKPSLDDFNTSIDALVDRNTLLAYTAVLAQFWNSGTLTGIVLSVFTLTLISFVVFGKK